MVKQIESLPVRIIGFESDVISDSGKTFFVAAFGKSVFESDVISDSGKTSEFCGDLSVGFESDVFLIVVKRYNSLPLLAILSRRL